MRTENSAEQFELCGMLNEFQNFPIDSYHSINVYLFPFIRIIYLYPQQGKS